MLNDGCWMLDDFVLGTISHPITINPTLFHGVHSVP